MGSSSSGGDLMKDMLIGIAVCSILGALLGVMMGLAI